MTRTWADTGAPGRSSRVCVPVQLFDVHDDDAILAGQRASPGGFNEITGWLDLVDGSLTRVTSANLGSVARRYLNIHSHEGGRAGCGAIVPTATRAMRPSARVRSLIRGNLTHADRAGMDAADAASKRWCPASVTEIFSTPSFLIVPQRGQDASRPYEHVVIPGASLIGIVSIRRRTVAHRGRWWLRFSRTATGSTLLEEQRGDERCVPRSKPDFVPERSIRQRNTSLVQPTTHIDRPPQRARVLSGCCCLQHATSSLRSATDTGSRRLQATSLLRPEWRLDLVLSYMHP
jgi:hypothetical protein